MRHQLVHPGALWSRAVFPEEFSETQHRLLSRVMDKVDSSGAVRDPCQSRVLESVLALRLLERIDVGESHRVAIREYLLRQARSAEGLDRVFLTRALLGGRGRAPFPRMASGIPEFTTARKRALVDSFSAIVDDQFIPDWDDASFSVAGLHSWAVVQVTSVKVILAYAAGLPEMICDEDVRLLLETQKKAHVWESNVLIHLSVLHALARLPGTDTVVCEGISKVLELQRPDGGFPFVSDTDTWCTATAGVALAAAGAPPPLLHKLAGHLARRQQPGGGWSYTDRARQTDVDDTSVAVQFLKLLDKRGYREAISRGTASLCSVQGSDGGFPTYVTGAPPEPSMTAAALDALSWSAHRPVLIRGLRYLAAQQLADGSFPPDWSSSRLHTVFRVLLVASRNPDYLPDHVRSLASRCLGLVLSEQNADGGWGSQAGDPSDVISTAYGLIALCGQSNPEPAVHAAAFIIAALRSGGSARMISDSVGPRGFVFTVPVLVEIFTLLAFGHLDRRLSPVSPKPGEFSFGSVAR